MGRTKKIPWYVTCELHDSYFRLMTIKHAISKIEWVLNHYITQLSSSPRGVASWVAGSWVPVPVPLKIGRSYRRDVVGKATLGRRGLWALMSWGPEKMLIRCRKESHHPAEWPLGLWLSIRRTRKTQRDGHKFGVKIFKLCSVSNSLSHANLEQPFRTLAIKWEVNIC